MSQIVGIAGQIKERLHVPFDQEELVSYGVQGLLEAAERYDHSSSAAFFTFAYYRVRGAMFDGLRSMGWLGRREYTRYRAESSADLYLEGLAEEEAFDESIAEANGKPEGGSEASAETEAPASAGDPAGDSDAIEKTLEEVSQALAGVAAIFVTSMEETRAPEQLTPTEMGAEHQLIAEERRRFLVNALAMLPERERRLIELYYLQGKTLDDAGAELGLSKSWACRLHTRAIGFLRAAFERPTKAKKWTGGPTNPRKKSRELQASVERRAVAA